MGTTQSKIKEGYSIKQKPLFKKSLHKGIKTSMYLEQKRLISPNGKNHQILQSESNSRQKQRIFSAQMEQMQQNDTRRESKINCKSYPASAIGLIQSRIQGTIKYSTGGLIHSNIVITSAHGLISNKILANPTEVKFILDYEANRVEFEVERIFIPPEIQSLLNNLKINNEKSLFVDYAIILLKDHVNLQTYGTLGLDFSRQNDDGNSQCLLYGFSQRNYTFKLESIRLRTKIQQKTIRITNFLNFEVAGGPILSIIDDECMIIGIHNDIARDQQKCLKLNDEIYNQINVWATRQEEEIDLRDKKLGKEGIKKLVNLKWTTLYTINISRNILGSQGLKYFTKCEWSNLMHFDIGGNQIKKQGVNYLVKIPMKNLVTLNMWGNSIGSQGAHLLLQGNWKYLSNINLYNNSISNEGVKNLILANWKELQSLNLGKNNVDAQIIPTFQYSVWKNIISLNLWGNLINNDKPTLSQLKKYFTKIKFLYL